MNFNYRDFARFQRVVKSNGCMRVGCSIQNDGGALFRCLLNPAHQFAFMIRLAKLQRCSICQRFETCMDVSEGLVPVNLGLA